MLPGDPGTSALQSRKDWSLLLDWRLVGPVIDRMLAEDLRLDAGQRTAAMDMANLVVPRARASRF